MGFVGLAIFLAILIVAWRNASAVLSITRERPELSWANHLARSLQYAVIPYIVSGAALNMAYFDLSYTIFALLAGLRLHVEARAAETVSFSDSVLLARQAG
jgi:hypothetical protein